MTNRRVLNILTAALLRPTRERFALQGMEVRTGTPEEFNAVMRSDFDRWARMSTEIGFKMD